jgi:hypothetical protein
MANTDIASIPMVTLPLFAGVDSVDARAPPGHVIVQRGVGAQPYSVLDRGGLPASHANRLVARAAGNLADAERANQRTLGQRVGGGRQRGGPKFTPQAAEKEPSMSDAADQVYNKLDPVHQQAVDVITSRMHMQGVPAGQKAFSQLQAANGWSPEEANAIEHTSKAKYAGDLDKPAGATVNVGLHVGDPANGGRVMSPDEAIGAIKAAGGKVGKTSLVQSNTKPTLVADLDKPFAKKDLGNLSKTLEQGAIAQRNADGSGIRAGPQAKDWGGKYNPDFFRDHSGATSPGAGQAGAGKAGPAFNSADKVRIQAHLKTHLANAAQRLESVRQGRKGSAADEDVPF